MNCNGDNITIIPCGYGDIKDFSDVDWYLMNSQMINFTGGETLAYVAQCIDRYQEYLDEDAKALESLKEHIRKHGKNSDWDFVSDYHKDIFGHRPHVGIEKLIAWANSDSTNSARYY